MDKAHELHELHEEKKAHRLHRLAQIKKNLRNLGNLWSSFFHRLRARFCIMISWHQYLFLDFIGAPIVNNPVGKLTMQHYIVNQNGDGKKRKKEGDGQFSGQFLNYKQKNS
jgi:hypothetical protein